MMQQIFYGMAAGAMLCFIWLTVIFAVVFFIPHDVGRWAAQVRNAYVLWKDKDR